MNVPYAWGSSGKKMVFSEQRANLGFYGVRALTERIGVIVSGSLLSYGQAAFFSSVPEERIVKTAMAGPWSITATGHIIEWRQSGLGAQVGVGWLFASMPGEIGPYGVVELNLGRKLDPIRSELWADMSTRLSMRNETRPRGDLQLGIKHHHKHWRWEVKGAVEATAALTRSGPTSDRIVLVGEQPVSIDSSFVTVVSESGKYLGDSFTGSLAGTWYVVRGVGIDLYYGHTFWGRGASAARTIAFGVSYGWRKKS